MNLSLDYAQSPAMECPHCTTSVPVATLTTRREGPLELDQCPKCHGLWFDAGELDEFRRTTSTAAQETSNKPFVPSGNTARCPRCTIGKTLTLGMTGDHPAGQCSACHGAWVRPSMNNGGSGLWSEMTLHALIEGLGELLTGLGH